MDEYLRHIKSVADSLAAIKSLVSDLELIQYTLNVLGSEYDNFVDNLSFMPGDITLDEVRTRLLFHERRVQFVHNCDHGSAPHQAFAVATTATTGSTSLNQSTLSKGRNSKVNKGRNNNNRNNKGRNNNN